MCTPEQQAQHELETTHYQELQVELTTELAHLQRTNEDLQGNIEDLCTALEAATDAYDRVLDVVSPGHVSMTVVTNQQLIKRARKLVGM